MVIQSSFLIGFKKRKLFLSSYGFLHITRFQIPTQILGYLKDLFWVAAAYKCNDFFKLSFVSYITDIINN
jgi:hypothetical protein